MTDIHSKETRSYNMSRIRDKNTKPELLVRKFLFSKGFRYKLHDKRLPGKPDIVLPKYKTVIFVHGCFWHGHENCKKANIPKTRTEWWLNKINHNKDKDDIAVCEITKSGWKVMTVWECELNNKESANTLTHLAENIKSV